MNGGLLLFPPPETEMHIEPMRSNSKDEESFRSCGFPVSFNADQKHQEELMWGHPVEATTYPEQSIVQGPPPNAEEAKHGFPSSTRAPIPAAKKDAKASQESASSQVEAKGSYRFRHVCVPAMCRAMQEKIGRGRKFQLYAREIEACARAPCVRGPYKSAICEKEATSASLRRVRDWATEVFKALELGYTADHLNKMSKQKLRKAIEH